MAKVGVQQSVNKDKIEALHSQFEEVVEKREELSTELNRLTTIAVKLQGAIEVLEGMEEEESDKKEEK
tara:strand:+ start:57 stop:260 length:204 start_codon:yes stop_codon:yes gene_type:complete